MAYGRPDLYTIIHQVVIIDQIRRARRKKVKYDLGIGQLRLSL